MRSSLILLAIASVADASSSVPIALTPGSPPGLSIQWLESISTPGADWINDIVPDNSGHFRLVGFVDRRDEPNSDWRALRARIDSSGRILERRHYGAGGGIDAFWTISPQPDGSDWIAGFTSRVGAGGIDAWAARSRRDGTLAVDKTFGGPGYDRFTGLAAAPDGHVFVGHSQPEGSDRRRLLAVKLNSLGAEVWQTLIDADPEGLGALYVEPAGDGGFVIAGVLSRGTDRDIFVLKLDAAGKELWRRAIGTPGAEDVNHGLLVRPDGTILVVGYVKSWGSRDNDILAATLSPDGTLIKKALLGGEKDDRPILVKAAADGTAWVVGYSRSGSVAGDWNMVVARLDARGEFMPGVAIIGSAADDNGTAILPLPDGGAIVAGYSKALGTESEDAFVARLSPADWATSNSNFERRSVP